MRRAGILIDGIEFIPQAIVDKHIPFGVPPGQTIEVLWAEADPSRSTALIISRDDLRVGDWLLGWITSSGTPYTFPVPGRVADPTRAVHNRNDAHLIVIREDEP